MHLPSFIISHLPQRWGGDTRGKPYGLLWMGAVWFPRRWGGATRGKPYGLLWMAVYDIHRHDVSTICE